MKKRDSSVTTLFRFFESAFADIAKSYKAADMLVPSIVHSSVLEKADYFTSFPDLAIPIKKDLFLNPAICYHVYESMSNKTIKKTELHTVQGACFRTEKEYEDMKRMLNFTMREIVVLGSNKDVEKFRQDLMTDIQAFAARLKLAGAIEKASDPFFVSAANRGKILLQKLYPLKYELRLTVGPHESIAVASFNNHQDFFGKRFNITLKDGKPAHSGCVAFGLERWVFCYNRVL